MSTLVNQVLVNMLKTPDPDISKVKALLHFDGTNGSTDIVDQAGHVFTATGGAVVSTDQSALGVSSLKLSGAANCKVSTPYSSDFEIEDGSDFTIDCRVYRNASGVQHYICSKRVTIESTAMGWELRITDANKVQFVGLGAGNYTGNITIPSTTWTYIAVSSINKLLRVYVNGVLDISVNMGNYGVAPNIGLTIGASSDGSEGMNGFIDEFRFTKNLGRYSDTKLPDVAPLAFADPVYWAPVPPTVTADPYFFNTVALLHLDGANGSTTIINSAASGMVINPTGDAKLSNTQAKFGSTSLYLDGTDDRLVMPFDHPGLDFGNGDFTIEGWVYFPAAPGSGLKTFMCGQSDLNTAAGSSYVLYCSGSSTSDIYIGSTAVGVATPQVTAGGWHHIALTRAGSVLRSFLDGALVGTNTSAGGTINPGVASYAPCIGAYGNSGAAMTGYVDDVRITKGVARYTYPFTIPATAFPDLPADILPGYTTGLLHFDGTDGSTTITDEKGSVFTANGGAALTTAATKFGTTSLYLDGVNDYVVSTDVNAFGFGSGDFTVEFFLRLVANASSTGSTIIGMQMPAAAGDTQFYVVNRGAGNILGFFAAGRPLGAEFASTLVSLNTWHHVAFVRKAGMLSCFLNGVALTLSDGSTTQNFNMGSSSPLSIGATTSGGSPVNAYVDELRVTNGVARYSSAFTVPNASFTLYDADPWRQNVSLALHGDGADGGAVITDSGPLALPMTYNTGVVTKTNQSVFGGSSLYFSGGASAYMYYPDRPQLAFGADDFTIEFWFRTPSTSNSRHVFSKANSNSQLSWTVWMSGGTIDFNASADGISWNVVQALTIGTSLLNDTWYHAAITRQGNTWRTFLNGTLASQSTASGTIYNNSTMLTLGAHYAGAGNPWNGWLDDFRITKGVARYTASFPKPLAPFPDV